MKYGARIHGGSRGARRRGQALVPVVFVVMVVTAFAVVLTGVARRELRAAAASTRHTRMFYVARGAVNYAAVQLQQATSGGTTYPELTSPPDTDSNGWTMLGDGWYKIDIIDTAARVNINTATAAGLNTLPGLSSDPSIGLAIVDWRDSDDTPGTLEGSIGAESEYYLALPAPYAPKNGPFDTVDELLLVRGITPSLLYGSPSTAGARSGSRQSGDPLETGQSSIPLAEMLTTYSRERNVASDGTRRINVKTADADTLVSTLGLPPQVAQRLIEQRGQNGANLSSIAGLLDIPGFTRQIMQQIGDKITVTDDEYRAGVININTAPAEVLAAIPNVDQTIYNAVIEARQGGTVFTGLNDLFQLTALNRQQLQALVDNVCTKSSVYLVRIKVRERGAREVRAFQALIEVQPPTQAEDGTEVAAQPKVYQFREVGSDPGWRSWTTGAFASGGSIGF
ncbi:MAG: general secretion pathway protein GspK [Chthonomonadales bacterium]|nr:general secretion pathway protein GspK [Chthonomonadales bacterium]